MAMTAIKSILAHSSIRDTKDPSDTIRVWESHREQATLWRAIALVQIPTTLIALVFAVLMWTTRDIVLNVPDKPLPGVYSVSEIPLSEFVDAATRYINLIGTYQPAVAERQFGLARQLIIEPMLSKFDEDLLQNELRAIQNTKRSQVFFVDPIKTQVMRDARTVYVTLTGERYKIVAGKELPPQELSFVIQLTTIPKNEINPYGIVITNVNLQEK